MKPKKAKFPYVFIGKQIEIIDASNKSYIGIKGKVLDERKNSLLLLADNKEKLILKNQLKKIKIGSLMLGSELIKKKIVDRLKV